MRQDLWQSIQRVQEDGRFLFASLKPGDYKLLAFAAAPSNEIEFFAWLANFADRALAVKIEEGSQQVIDPPAITPD